MFSDLFMSSPKIPGLVFLAEQEAVWNWLWPDLECYFEIREERKKMSNQHPQEKECTDKSSLLLNSILCLFLSKLPDIVLSIQAHCYDK